MSTKGSKRPESVSDLASYEKTETLVRIKLSDLVLAGGRVLSAAETLINVYRDAYPGDEVRVKFSGDSLEIEHPLNETELAAKLEQAQRMWDYAYPEAGA